MIFVSSIDDFFVDMAYWFHRFRSTVRKNTGYLRFTPEELAKYPQRPIAIIVPAWQEASVIARMASRAAARIDYRNYHIFIGTYPNDRATQMEVDKVAREYSFVHKVVTSRPGPTSKADCLNHVIRDVVAKEQQLGMEFALAVMHDAEDVIHDQELKCFNYLLHEYDMVQLPVLPLRRRWYQFTSGHYIDEFSETHYKLMYTRSRTSGFVPSAGVGTGLGRNTMIFLMEHNDGNVFDESSLTEDYDMGYRVLDRGLRSAFVTGRFIRDGYGIGDNFKVDPESSSRDLRKDFIAIREYFPARFWQAVRQKSRWILGIVFQATRSIGWPKGWMIRYALYRDRKAVFTMLSMAVAYLAVVNVLAMELIYGFGRDLWWFPTLIPPDSWVWTLLYCNGFFLLWRLMHRMGFVYYLYGTKEALLSAPRMVWGNIINIFAMLRAIAQLWKAGKKPDRIEWDKTDHEFPDD